MTTQATSSLSDLTPFCRVQRSTDDWNGIYVLSRLEYVQGQWLAELVHEQTCECFRKVPASEIRFLSEPVVKPSLPLAYSTPFSLRPRAFLSELQARRTSYLLDYGKKKARQPKLDADGNPVVKEKKPRKNEKSLGTKKRSAAEQALARFADLERQLTAGLKPNG